ncbi:phage tail tube protein [Paenibacillus agilis]|uniref:Phage portal protein n=1 Tax=Paenibacillus agilis TaxID=3020863 RepID=A0A559IX87_9BACL|nr:phage tail tube protein [Paenibacillus agilis]TVX92223.1 phage portal protein [Paenibacillus agilis]
MPNVDVNKIINGLYGYVYDENGRELDTTQEFEFKDEFEKVEFKLPGEFHSKHKVMGGKLTGKVKFLKVDSRLQKKIADNPAAKFNYIGKLADPNSDGQEAILMRGVSFDSNPIMAYKLGESVEIDINFTADSYEYQDTIE